MSRFGICRSRKDGRNLYCKRCISQKVAESRQKLREYKAAKKANRTVTLPLFDVVPPVVVPVRCLAADDRVKAVMREGARTLQEIAKRAQMDIDLVDVTVATLVLQKAARLTNVANDVRYYCLRELPLAPIARKPMQIAQGFSRLQGIMPGRKTG